MTVQTEVFGEVPSIDVDPFASEYRDDRLPMYGTIRESAAVVWLEKYQSYAVARYDEVNTVMRDYARFTNTGGSGLADTRKPGSWREPALITSIDPPEHTVIRKALNKILSPAAIKAWRDNISDVAPTLVTRLVAGGGCDIVTELAETYILSILPPALGVEMTREQAVTMGDYNFNALGPQNDLYEHSAKRLEAHMEWVNRNRAGIGLRQGWAQLIFDAEDRGEIPSGSASSLMLALLRGGMDTAISTIGYGVTFLAQHPDQWDALRSDRSLMSGAFNETVRFATPIQSYYRTTTQRTQLGGYDLEADRKIQILVASANRDPRRWVNPDRFDITRNATGHLSFGAGVHTCIGQYIARIVYEDVMMPLLEQVKTLHLTDKPRVRHLNMLNTLDTARVDFERA